jgi:membrane protease YdiL (CAAX protease family)
MLATATDSSCAGSLLAETACCRLNLAVDRPAASVRHPVRLVSWLVFVVSFMLLSYASRAGGVETPDDVAYRWSSSIGAAVQFVLMLGVLLLIAIGLPKRELFALRRPRSWRRALGLSALALVVIYATAIVYTQVLTLFGDWDPSEEQGLVPDGWDPSRVAPFVAFFLAVTVLAPVVEELTYRGLGMTLLLPYSTVLAVVVSGLLFGGAHGLLVGLPVLVVFGVVNAVLRLRTDSVYPPILVHGAFNAIAMVASVSGAG